MRSFFPLRKKKTKTRFDLKGWRLMGKWTRKMPWKLKFTQKCYLLGATKLLTRQNISPISCWYIRVGVVIFPQKLVFSADFSEHWNLVGKIWFSFSLAPLFFMDPEEKTKENTWPSDRLNNYPYNFCKQKLQLSSSTANSVSACSKYK